MCNFFYFLCGWMPDFECGAGISCIKVWNLICINERGQFLMTLPSYYKCLTPPCSFWGLLSLCLGTISGRRGGREVLFCSYKGFPLEVNYHEIQATTCSVAGILWEWFILLDVCIKREGIILMQRSGQINYPPAETSRMEIWCDR